MNTAEISDETNSIRAPEPKSLFTSFLITVAGIAIFVMLVSRLGRWFFLAELAGNFHLQLGVMSLVLPVALLLRGAKKTAAATFLVALLTLVNPLFPYVQSRDAYLPNAQSVRIMSFNIFAANSDHEAIRQTILHSDPDVLLLVEFTPFVRDVHEAIKDKFPHQVCEPRYHGFGIALYSKYPIDASTVWYLTHRPSENQPTTPVYDWADKDDPCIDATINVAGTRVRVIGLHLFNPTAYNRYLDRADQFQRLIELADDGTKLPLVVMGDFNCTPWSSFFTEFLAKTGLRDSRRGFGYHGTWPSQGDFMSIPIDHVLVSKDISVRTRTVEAKAGSDHYPITCEISVPK